MLSKSRVQKEHPSICYRSVAAVLETFGNPTRLKILYRLLDHPYGVNEIAKAIGAKQANISKQFGILKKAGLVRGTRNGNRMTYSVDDPYVKRIVGMGIKLHRGVVNRKIVDLGMKS